jgi:hypothetical protein
VKGFIGTDAGWLEPGETVVNGTQRITIVRKVTEEEALESAARSDLNVVPVVNEHWYEVDISLAPVTDN